MHSLIRMNFDNDNVCSLFLLNDEMYDLHYKEMMITVIGYFDMFQNQEELVEPLVLTWADKKQQGICIVSRLADTGRMGSMSLSLNIQHRQFSLTITSQKRIVTDTLYTIG